MVNADAASSPGDVTLAIDPASEQLDQNNPYHSWQWHTVKDEDWCAQSFVAGMTGSLTKVALYLKKKNNPGQLTIEIRDTAGSNHEPGDTVYTSITTSDVVSSWGQEYQFTFSSPATLTSGTHYAIVLHEPGGVGGNGRYCWAEFSDYDIYPDGNAWLSDDSGSGWSAGGCGIHDFYFTTYITGGYYSSGALTSSVHDTGYAADFGAVSWNATTPAGTTLKFQIATNSDNSTWNFKGNDGTSGTYYTSSGAGIWTGHDGDRYIKYKAFFDTGDNSKTPTLHDVSITYVQQIVLPAVVTGNATLVEETTARLGGTISGDGGEACQYRFEYDTDSGEPYTFNTAWTGNLTVGQPFSANVTGLSEGTKYYYRAQAKNSHGTGCGVELDFLTKPDPPVTFTAGVAGDTRIDLSWTKGAGANRTMVRGKLGDYPADRDDGYPVYFDTGTSASDTGLTPNTTYYYKAWSEVTGSQQWSDGFAAAVTTTGSAEPPTAVGGTVYPVNKAGVMAPWLGSFAGLCAIIINVIFRLWKKRARRVRAI